MSKGPLAVRWGAAPVLAPQAGAVSRVTVDVENTGTIAWRDGPTEMEQPPSAAVGLVLSAMCQAAGWPFPKGGSQKIADALVSNLRSQGGEV